MLKNELFFIIVDETFLKNQKFVHVLIGLIKNPTKVYLIKSCILKTVDGNAIKSIIIDAINEVELKKNNFMLLISDAARYMIFTGKLLKEYQKNLFHITCIAHLLHNCVMKIKEKFKQVDNLIGYLKLSISKSNERKQLFKKIPLPPDVIITRWGSWLKSASYLSKYLPELREIVSSFKSDGIIVERVKNAILEESLTRDLSVIQMEYDWIRIILEKCENMSYTIKDVCNDLNLIDIKNDIANITEYFNRRFNTNEISDLINMKNQNISPQLYVMLFKCQPTSISVERSFSLLKKLYQDDRNFNYENIYLYIYLYFNNNI